MPRPQAAASGETTRRVNAADSGDGEVPEEATTAGSETTLASRPVLLVASGESKARALATALAGSVFEAVPTSVPRRYPDATLLTDRAAASAQKRGAA